MEGSVTAKIDKRVPLPLARLGKYPWREMQVGDSFLVEREDQRAMGAKASTAGRRLGRKFATRVVEGGIRVWRVA